MARVVRHTRSYVRQIIKLNFLLLKRALRFPKGLIAYQDRNRRLQPKALEKLFYGPR